MAQHGSNKIKTFKYAFLNVTQVLYFSHYIVCMIIQYYKNSECKNRSFRFILYFPVHVLMLTCLKMAYIQAKTCGIHVKVISIDYMNLCCVRLNKCHLFRQYTILNFSVQPFKCNVCGLQPQHCQFTHAVHVVHADSHCHPFCCSVTLGYPEVLPTAALLRTHRDEQSGPGKYPVL